MPSQYIDAIERNFRDIVRQLEAMEKNTATNSNNGANGGNSGNNTTKKTSSSSSSYSSYGYFGSSQHFQTMHHIEEVMGDIVRKGNQFLEPWIKVDNAASRFAKNIGLSARGMENLRKAAIDLARNEKLGIKFNVRPEDLIALRENYSKAVGRIVSQTNQDLVHGAAMTALMGSVEAASDFANKLENFGISMTEAGNMAGKMFAEAGRRGIVFEKYSETFKENVKKAQEYTFQKGVRGVAEMAKRATELKLSMSEAFSFAEKVNTVEGAITTGANLQVLGGPFTQFSNPLQMLNESLNDVESLQDRMVKMFGNLAQFNRETGQVEISAFNKMRIRAAAQSMGINPSEVFESVTNMGRRNEIERQAQGNIALTSNKDFMDLVKNIATIQNGEAGVMVNGKFKKVSELQGSDQRALEIMQKSESEDIKDIAQMMRSWDDVISGRKAQYDAIKATTVETVGIGQGLKNLNKTVGSINTFLWTNLIARGVQQGAGSIFRALDLFGGQNLEKLKAGERVSKKIGGHTWGLRQTKGHGLRLYKGASLARVQPGAIGAGAAGIGIGLAAMGAGIRASSQLNKKRQSGEVERGSAEDRWRNRGNQMLTWGGAGAAAGAATGIGLGAAGAAAAGATIGSAVPILGTAIGALLGAATGYAISVFKNQNNKRAAQIKKELERGKDGIELVGDYRKKDLQAIKKALADDNRITMKEYQSFNKRTRDMLVKSGDANLFPELRELTTNTENVTVRGNNITIEGKVSRRKGEDGGMLIGPSHRNGGMPILGSNIEVEGGEFVMNRHSTQKFLPILNQMNQMGKGGIIKPRMLADGGMLDVVPSIPTPRGGTTESISVNPIKVELTGTIKLDGGNGKTVDLDALLNDNTFKQKLAKILEVEISKKANGGIREATRSLSNLS